MRPQRRLAREIEALPRRRRERLRQRRLAHRRDRKPRPRRSRVQDQLPRHPQRVREDRAQALVARHHVAQRGLQRRAIERARKPHRQRDRVGRARAPSRRSRNHSRRCANDSGISAGRATGTQRRTRRLRAVAAAWPAPRPSAPRTGCGSQARHPSAGADAADQPRRQQRMAAEREEVVVDADPLEPQHLGKQRRTASPPAACAAPRRTRRRQLRRRQRRAVELAVRRQRQPSSTTNADGTM